MCVKRTPGSLSECLCEHMSSICPAAADWSSGVPDFVAPSLAGVVMPLYSLADLGIEDCAAPRALDAERLEAACALNGGRPVPDLRSPESKGEPQHD
jgi:hypothetical protein